MGYYDDEQVDISILLGKTLKSVKQVDDTEIVFETVDGEIYRMCHYQDCCESVTIDDIEGDLTDLIETPITQSEMSQSQDENPDGLTKGWQDSFTWTFYKLATIKGYVTIRWYGESNGYYSEEVSFAKIS